MINNSTKYWWSWHLIKWAGGAEFQYAWHRSAYHVAKMDEIKKEIEDMYRRLFEKMELDWYGYIDFRENMSRTIDKLLLDYRDKYIDKKRGIAESKE